MQKHDFDNYKKIYYSIRFLNCRALNNEKIYFNNHGFNHLIRKNKLVRVRKDFIRRLRLIKFVRVVILSGSIVAYREVDVFKYWSISLRVGGKNVFVIIRKIRNGKLHFYSIFDE